MISLDAIPDPPAGRRMPARIAHGARDAGLSVRRARRRRRRVPETCMEQCIGKCVDLTQIHKGPVGIWGPGEGGGCCTGSALPHPCALSCTIRDRKRAQSSAPAARHDVLTRSRAHALTRSRGLLDQHRALGTRLDDCRLVLDRARGHVETDLRSGCAHLWYRPGGIGQAQSRNRQWPAVEEVERERGRGSGIEGG